MSLSRQLVILMLALTGLLFVGSFAIGVQNSRSYLQEQLASHAQDAATSLGLSISTALAQQDTATVQSMVDAIYDRGYYRQLRVVDTQGEAIVERSTQVRIEGVPAWFIRLFALETPEGRAQVMMGWKQAGEVRVSSHPGLAYAQLWNNSVETLVWYVLSAALVLLAALVALRVVLRPLVRVENQADAICRRQFLTQDRVPHTRELRRITDAMNRLSMRVEQMLSDSEQLAARLRVQALEDPVTGLANRRHFVDVLEHRVEAPDLFARGALLLLQLKRFKEYNDKYGFAAGDELLRDVAGLLHERLGDNPRATLARLAGADFAILFEDTTREEVATLAEQLAVGLTTVPVASGEWVADVGHVGVALFRGQSVSDLLAEADMALRAASRQGANQWVVSWKEEPPAQATRGASEWQEWITTALAEGRLELDFQPVLSCADESLLQREALARLRDGDTRLTAAVFLPLAETLGLAAALDRAVLEKVLGELDTLAADAPVAVNLSPVSLADHEFLDWLERRLVSVHGAERLVLELPEHGAVADLDQVRELMRRLEGSGVRFSLDHFGKAQSSFAYLRSLPVHYLKVDGSFVRNLEANGDNQFFLQALGEIAHGLEIQVIAESVESPGAWGMIQSLRLDGGQGYYLEPPG